MCTVSIKLFVKKLGNRSIACVLNGLYAVCSLSNYKPTAYSTEAAVNEAERIARLMRTLHSLATRIPRVVLKRVETIFPALRKKLVSSVNICCANSFYPPCAQHLLPEDI